MSGFRINIDENAGSVAIMIVIHLNFISYKAYYDLLVGNLGDLVVMNKVTLH